MYERLYKEAEHLGVSIYERPLTTRIKGLYADNVIWINRNIPTKTEKACILAEELGHYHTSIGDIIDQKDIRNRKQEKIARLWAYEKLVPLSKIVQAHKAAIRNKHELAEFLDVTEQFLEDALKRYKEKYGLTKQVDNYTICFDPLGVIDWFE